MRYRIVLALYCVPALLPAQTLTQKYKEPASRLISEALNDHSGYQKLAWLCDRIGNRSIGCSRPRP